MLVAIECAMLVFFLALAIALIWVPYMSACRQHRVSGHGCCTCRHAQLGRRLHQERCIASSGHGCVKRNARLGLWFMV